MVGVAIELRTRARLAGLLAGCLLTLPLVSQTPQALGQSVPAIPPGPSVKLEYEYYPVRGRNAAEVLQSLKKNAPRSDGDSFFGLTTSQTGFSYQLVSVGQRCAVENLGVRTEIRITLPRWKAPANTPQALLDQWDKFMAQLSEHELWHAETSRRGNDEIYHAVRNMQGGSCEALDARARREIDKLSAAIERRNEEYDRLTDHGRKEGIVWIY